MARRRVTAEELAEMGERGESGGTLGEQEAKKREAMEEDGPRKKKREYFKGRRDKRTILDMIKGAAGYGSDD